MPSYKVIRSGNVIEIYEYENPLMMDTQVPEKGGKEEKEDTVKKDRSKEHKERSAQRARNEFKRLVLANFNKKALLITLTYAEHVTDIGEANKDFKKFIQRMRRRFGKEFKYATVIEFTKIGRIHFHMLCDIEHDLDPHIKYEEKAPELKQWEYDLGSIWRNGWVFVKPVSHVDNLGAYLIKYMSKNFIDERFAGKDRYNISRNMIKPQVIKGEEAMIWLDSLVGRVPVFTSEYKGHFDENIKYAEYNLERIEGSAYVSLS